MIHLHNMDCMEAMAQMPDNAFELAICDPPYGAIEHMQSGGGKTKMKQLMHWDKKPSKKYFEQLQRVSRYQIIFGGNYFCDYLPISNCWFIWHKGKQLRFPEFEMAWTNTKKPNNVFYMSRADANINKITYKKFHPTAKPKELYMYLLNKYAKKGWRILDTHLGSGSSAIAAYNAGYEFVGYEIDTDYYNAAKKRFENHKRQIRMF